MANNAMFLRMPAVVSRTGLSKATIYLLIAAGKFPKPVKISARASAWVHSEITRWERNCVDSSRGRSAV